MRSCVFQWRSILMFSQILLMSKIFVQACELCDSPCDPGYHGKNCEEEVKCSGVVLEGSSANIERATIITGRDEVKYGEKAVIECLREDNTTITKIMYCAFDNVTGKYRLQGDTPLCPVVDCGEPLFFRGQIKMILSRTIYGSSFVFECINEYRRTGASSQGTIVECKANGRWDYGDLSCTPVTTCRDPGTPANGRQITKGYEVGQTVRYVCERDGYTPVPYDTLECLRIGAYNVNWNASMPTCVDTTSPVFVNCPEEGFDAFPMETKDVFVPEVTDNSGLVVSLTSDYPFRSIVVNETKVIRFTALDGMNNSAECLITYNKVPFYLECPDFLSIPTNSTPYYLNLTNVVSTNGALAIDPEAIIVGLERTDNKYTIVNVAASLGTSTLQCSFQVHVYATKCDQKSLRYPKNAFLECEEDTSGDVRCVTECKPGKYFSDGTVKKTYNCSGENVWTSNIVEDCVDTGRQVILFTSWYAECITSAIEIEFYNFVRGRCAGNAFQSELKNKTITAKYVPLSKSESECAEEAMILFFRSNDSCIKSISFMISNICYLGERRTINRTQTCLLCAPGTFWDKVNYRCQPCSSTEYQNSSGAEECEKCPIGTFTDNHQRRELADCKGCGRGFISANGGAILPCKPCPVDTYWAGTGTCKPCPVGTLTGGNIAATHVDFCRDPCQEGLFSYTGYGSCTACPENFYSNRTGSDACIECPVGTYTVNVGETSPEQCRNASELCQITICNTDQTCRIRNHEAVCECKEGNTGENCENPPAVIDYCASTPCWNNGSCQSDPSGFKCDCDTPFIGEQCEFDLVDDCVDKQCPIDGFCQDGIGTASCVCAHNTSSCDEPPDLCRGLCERGECKQFGIVRAHCICPPDYTGQRCETEIKQCEINPTACWNGGTCIEIPGEGNLICVCPSGYSGERCQIPPPCARPPTTQAPCAGYSMKNGVGYKAHNDCSKYMTCDMSTNSQNPTIETLSCGYGYFWNPVFYKCIQVSQTDCNSDQCKNIGTQSYKTSGKCYQYYKCENGRTVKECCPYGNSYNPDLGRCSLDFGCIQPVSPSDDPCRHYYIVSFKVSGQCHEYYYCGDRGKVKRYCGNGLSYPKGWNNICQPDQSCRRSDRDPDRPTYSLL